MEDGGWESNGAAIRPPHSGVTDIDEALRQRLDAAITGLRDCHTAPAETLEKTVQRLLINAQALGADSQRAEAALFAARSGLHDAPGAQECLSHLADVLGATRALLVARSAVAARSAAAFIAAEEVCERTRCTLDLRRASFELSSPPAVPRTPARGSTNNASLEASTTTLCGSTLDGHQGHRGELELLSGISPLTRFDSSFLRSAPSTTVKVAASDGSAIHCTPRTVCSAGVEVGSAGVEVRKRCQAVLLKLRDKAPTLWAIAASVPEASLERDAAQSLRGLIQLLELGESVGTNAMHGHVAG